MITKAGKFWTKEEILQALEKGCKVMYNGYDHVQANNFKIFYSSNANTYTQYWKRVNFSKFQVFQEVT